MKTVGEIEAKFVKEILFGIREECKYELMTEKELVDFSSR
jgi:hypothetical protein